jgi:hypothetical protein
MVLSASFTVGALITYWSIVYQRAGFHVSSAGMVWLPIGVLAFIVSFITYSISRRTAEAAAEAIQRQRTHRHPADHFHFFSTEVIPVATAVSSSTRLDGEVGLRFCSSRGRRMPSSLSPRR